jgi:hypothetical protein
MQLYIVIEIIIPPWKGRLSPPSPFVKGCETGGAKTIRRLPRLVIAYCQTLNFNHFITILKTNINFAMTVTLTSPEGVSCLPGFFIQFRLVRVRSLSEHPHCCNGLQETQCNACTDHLQRIFLKICIYFDFPKKSRRCNVTSCREHNSWHFPVLNIAADDFESDWSLHSSLKGSSDFFPHLYQQILFRKDPGIQY